MIKAWIIVDRQSAGQLMVLPAVPTVGTILLVDDDGGGERRLAVNTVEMPARTERQWQRMEEVQGEFILAVFCDEI